MPNFGISSDGSRMFLLEGELDMATAPLMTTAIDPAVTRGGPFTLDLSDVTFVDSTGVAAYVPQTKRQVVHGGRPVGMGIGAKLWGPGAT